MAKQNYLIEGVSASGKSSVYKELKRRGYNAIDGDTLAEFRNSKTGALTEEHTHKNWMWIPEKIEPLLSNDDEHLFMCGGARNRKDYMHQFDKVFYLTLSESTLRHRLKNRPGDVFGKKENELKTVLKLHVTEKEKSENAITIDAEQPLSSVVDVILSQI